jgi:uncharacterized protein (DUF1778 family)
MAPVARNAARDQRLDLRIQGDLKMLIERAAALSGETLSTFVLGSTLRRARKVLREADVIELSNEARDRFLAVLDDADARPNAALMKAAERHKAMIG